MFYSLVSALVAPGLVILCAPCGRGSAFFTSCWLLNRGCGAAAWQILADDWDREHALNENAGGEGAQGDQCGMDNFFVHGFSWLG
jgi:hypothetical protein